LFKNNSVIPALFGMTGKNPPALPIYLFIIGTDRFKSDFIGCSTLKKTKWQG